MKRLASLALCAALALTGCSTAARQTETSETADTLRIVTTIFPVYDWVREILGEESDRVQLTMLLDSGVDLHSYQPTADDVVAISACDLFVYIGGESDAWTDDVLQTAENPDRAALSLLDVLGGAAKEEELAEGMQAEEDEEEDETEYDEHIWLSLRCAQTLCQALADQLCQIDPEHSEAYAAHAEAYLEKLAALDAAYQDAVEQGAKDTILFADRFPFRYLADDYGLTYYGAFAGCSAETEASFETIAFLAGKVDELGLDYVLTLEGTDHSIAETVIAATTGGAAEILTMDSMQSITAQDVENGATYLTLMEQNLAALTTALS